MIDIKTKIDNIIIKNGIPIYVKKWKPSLIKDYDIQNLNNYVKKYHPHASVEICMKNLIKDKIDKTNNNIDKKLPYIKFYKKERILYIKFFHYYLDFNDKMENDPIFTKIVNLVKKSLNKNFKGIIIDLRSHWGGWYFPFIASFDNLYNNRSLWCNTNNEKGECTWTNYKNNKISYSKKELKNKFLNNNYPIAILIGKNTISSGEFIASTFYRNQPNIKIFGENTGGYLSNNLTYNITSKIKLNLPIILNKSVDGIFHKKEFLEPNVKTIYPLRKAKEWINKTAL